MTLTSRALLARSGVTPATTVVVHSELSNLLGYPDIREYERSWVERDNRQALPIALSKV